MQLYPCELCGSEDLAEITCAPRYMAGRPLHVCRACGMVQVAFRKTPEEVKAAWADEMYRADEKTRLSDTTYTARMPAVHARQIFAADFIDEALKATGGLRGKSVCDLGAGEGQFLEMIRSDAYGAKVFAVEPSAANCDILRDRAIDCFEGVAEEYMDHAGDAEGSFDVVTLIWTLENCHSASGVMDAAWRLAKPGGHVAVATGSRILVPFKKPLQYYIGSNADVHPNHFSAHTLQGYLAEAGFRMTDVNRYIDSDYLVMVGEKTDRARAIDWPRDDAAAVLDFFERWDKETQGFYVKGGPD
ncbi:MAG: class I SAM-dependent methyltransferase [Rhodospirillaceae bacterium]